jgi:hypothetical protein
MKVHVEIISEVNESHLSEQVIGLICYSEHFLQNEDRGGQSVKPTSGPEESFRAHNSV